MKGSFLPALIVSATCGSNAQSACPSFDTASGDDEVSMLQARIGKDSNAGRSETHPPQHSQSNVLGKTQVMLASVTELAKHMSGDVSNVLEQLRIEVEAMMQMLEEEAETDRWIVNSQFAEIDACLSTHPIAGRVDAVEALCTQCSSCETDRLNREEHRTQVCDQWNSFANGLWTQMVGACQHSPSFLEEPRTGDDCHAGSCSRQGAEEVHQIAQAMQFWESNWVDMQEKRSACTEACSASTCISCEDDSRQFEEAFCNFQQHCGMLATCHARESGLYDEQIQRIHVADAAGLNTLQQENYLMNLQILCIVDLMDNHYPTNDTISDDSLETCSPEVLQATASVADKLEELDIPRRMPSALPDCSPSPCQGSCPVHIPQCLQAEEVLSEAPPATLDHDIINTGFTVSSSGSKVDEYIMWDTPTHAAHPIYSSLASIADDASEYIVVQNAGLYNVALQVLPISGGQMYPVLKVNGEYVLAGYGGSSSGYSAANMNTVLQLEANSRISVHFQVTDTGNLPYVVASDDSFGAVYHNLIIIPVQQVFSMLSTGAKSNGRLDWNLEPYQPPSMNSDVASVEDGAPQNVVVQNAGLYRVALQVLGNNGHRLSPVLEVNGAVVMSSYSDAPGGRHSAAHIDVLLQLEANSRISVHFQRSGESVFSFHRGTHNLIIMPVQPHTAFTMSSTGTQYSQHLAWDLPTRQGPPMASDVASVEDGSLENIIVQTAGLYNVALQVLPQAGSNVHPRLEVNGALVMTGYGGSSSSDSRTAATMNVLLQLEANSRISVGFPPDHGSVFTTPDDIHHNIIIAKV